MARAAPPVGAEVEVLAHGHAREAVPALGRERDPAVDDLVRRHARDVLAVERDRAALAGVRPEIERSVVDLPAPLEPISVTTSPSSTVSETPLSASIAP
jgi:hypothetical protein